MQASPMEQNEKVPVITGGPVCSGSSSVSPGAAPGTLGSVTHSQSNLFHRHKIYGLLKEGAVPF